MRQDTIAEIEIGADGRLHVVPTIQAFPYIYREAMEVHWDANRLSLYSPAPREWSYSRWLQQILAAAREQGYELMVTANTRWLNMDSGVKAELLQAIGNEA